MICMNLDEFPSSAVCGNGNNNDKLSHYITEGNITNVGCHFSGGLSFVHSRSDCMLCRQKVEAVHTPYIYEVGNVKIGQSLRNSLLCPHLNITA